MLSITDKLSMIMSATPRYTDFRNEGYTDDEAEEIANDAIGEAESEITNLQAENAALKAKLDEVREWCELAKREERGRCRAFANHLLMSILGEKE